MGCEHCLLYTAGRWDLEVEAHMHKYVSINHVFDAKPTVNAMYV